MKTVTMRMWRCGLPGITAVAAIALGAGGVGAQERLTLQDVLTRAAEYNPEYRQALNQLELAGAERRAAIGAFLPSLNLNLGTGVFANRQLTAFDNFGNPIENPVSEWRTSSNSSQGVSLSFDLFRGFTRFHAISQNNATAAAREMAAGASLANTEATLRREFNTSLRQSALREIEEEARAGRVADLESTNQLFRLAEVGTVDVSAAELEIIRQDRAISEATTNYRKALLNLRAAVGDPSLSEFEIIGEAADPFDPSALEIERLVQMALERNPTVLQRHAEIERDRAGLKSAKGARLPSLSVSAGADQGINGQDFTAFADPYASASRSARFSLSLSIPVFQRFQTSRDIASADISLRNAEQALRQAELNTERDVRSQYLDLVEAWNAYQINLQTRDLAERRLRLAREEYRLAAMTFTELQQAIRDALTERRNVINSRFNFLDALINLELTVGTGVAPTGAGN